MSEVINSQKDISERDTLESTISEDLSKVNINSTLSQNETEEYEGEDFEDYYDNEEEDLEALYREMEDELNTFDRWEEASGGNIYSFIEFICINSCQI
jgi:hypothetical protein